MNTQERKDMLHWAVASYSVSRKPHRAQAPYAAVAEDLYAILVLSQRRRDIATRYESGTQLSTDESVELQLIGKLECIGKKYGWRYGSVDSGLTGTYIVERPDLQAEIPIPILETIDTTPTPRSA